MGRKSVKKAVRQRLSAPRVGEGPPSPPPPPPPPPPMPVGYSPLVSGDTENHLIKALGITAAQALEANINNKLDLVTTAFCQQVAGPVAFYGVVYLVGGVALEAVSCTSVTTTGDITAGGNLITNGTLDVDGNATVGGNLVITLGLTVGENIGVTGNLTVQGNATIDQILLSGGSDVAPTLTLTSGWGNATGSLVAGSNNNRGEIHITVPNPAGSTSSSPVLNISFSNAPTWATGPYVFLTVKSMSSGQTIKTLSYVANGFNITLTNAPVASDSYSISYLCVG